MNLVEQKKDDDLYIEPLLVISRLAQLSVYPVGTIIHIIHDMPKLINISRSESCDTTEKYSKYKLNELIFTIERLWEPIIDYIDWYKTSLAEKYKSEYTTLTIRAIQGVQKLRDLAGSRVAIEAMLSRIVVLLAECCGVEVPDGLTSKRSPYVRSLFGSDTMPDLALTGSACASSASDVARKSIKRVDFKSFISLLNQYDSKITESEEELVFIREAMDSWIMTHFP
jgi:hypothetical protein